MIKLFKIIDGDFQYLPLFRLIKHIYYRHRGFRINYFDISTNKLYFFQENEEEIQQCMLHVVLL